MVKKRTIQQKSEDESKGVLLTLFKEWIVNPLNNDFGFDFEVRLTAPLDNKTQAVSEISFYVQNKSSINSENEKAIEDLKIDDWILFLGQRIPVLITKYDLVKKEFFWEIAQDYLWDIIEKTDQNWRRRKYKRIKLTKKINSLDEIRNAIIASQKRITRYHSLNLSIGEGIKIDEEELSQINKIREKSLEEYKSLSLVTAYYLKKKGNRKKAIKSLMDVYNSPNADEAKVRAIICIIFELNIVYLNENERIVTLANEAINLCKQLKIDHLKEYVTILRNQAIIYIIIKKMTEIQLGLKIQEIQRQKSFSFFYTQEFIKFYDILQKITREINDSLINLLKTKKIYYYLEALPILLEIFTIQTSLLAVFNNDVINEEKKLRKNFVEQIEYVLENIPQIDLKQRLSRSLANYYYYTLENEKAIAYLSNAIDLGKKDGNKFFVKANTNLLKKMKTEPNPYQISKTKNIDDMTVEEYQEMTKKLLKAQGITFDIKDQLTEAILIALRDLNPEEYFRHCEHLHISYVNQSVVGASIGLPSMGTKFGWCKYCKSPMVGFDLKSSFTSFKQENCESCTYLKPRSKKWICYVKWVKEQEQSTEFKKVLETFKKNWYGL